MTPKSLQLYRLLLYLYPARFREEYGTPMERQFADDYADASGRGERLGVWLRAIRDIAVTAPIPRLWERRFG